MTTVRKAPFGDIRGLARSWQPHSGPGTHTLPSAALGSLAHAGSPHDGIRNPFFFPERQPDQRGPMRRGRGVCTPNRGARPSEAQNAHPWHGPSNAASAATPASSSRRRCVTRFNEVLLSPGGGTSHPSTCQGAAGKRQLLLATVRLLSSAGTHGAAAAADGRASRGRAHQVQADESGALQPRAVHSGAGRAGLGPGPGAKAGPGEPLTSRHFLLGQEDSAA